MRIPREFELKDDAAILRKQRDRLIIGRVRKKRLVALLGKLDSVDSGGVDAAVGEREPAAACG